MADTRSPDGAPRADTAGAGAGAEAAAMREPRPEPEPPSTPPIDVAPAAALPARPPLDRRVRVALTVAVVAGLVAVAALLLGLRVQRAGVAAHHFAGSSVVLLSSAAETRALAADLRRHAGDAVLRPSDPTPAERFRSGRARLLDQVARVRTHTDDRHTGDVADDTENAALRYASAVEPVFAAAAAGRVEAARAALTAADADAGRLAELADELLTLTATTAEHGAHALDSGAFALPVLALALAGALVAAVALALAVAVAGPALAATLRSGRGGRPTPLTAGGAPPAPEATDAGPAEGEPDADRAIEAATGGVEAGSRGGGRGCDP